jgi:hypothetical protein
MLLDRYDPKACDVNRASDTKVGTGFKENPLHRRKVDVVCRFGSRGRHLQRGRRVEMSVQQSSVHWIGGLGGASGVG